MAIAWYISPYKQPTDTIRPTRYCVIDDFSSIIDYWQETEIEGDQALVKVRAIDATLTELGKAFTPVSDPRKIWTPTRTKPRNADGEIVLDGPKVATLDWHIIDKCVFDDAKYDDLLRRVDDYILLAERDGYVKIIEVEPERSLILQRAGKLGFGLDKISPGTFPTTGVLDTFDRADAATLGANWTDFINGWSIASNLAAAEVNAADNATLWSASTFGPDCEGYVEVPTKPPTDRNIGIWIRCTTTDVATIDGYIAVIGVASDTDVQQFYRFDNYAFTQLGANVTDEFAAGESLGAEMIGSTLALYNKVGGTWTQLATRTDTTYGAAGYIGLLSTSTTIRVDNFGGGTIAAAAKAPPPFQKHTNYVWNRRN